MRRFIETSTTARENSLSRWGPILYDDPSLANLRTAFKIVAPGGSVDAQETSEQPTSAAKSFLTVAVIALVVCAALVGGAVFLLSGSSQLPFNYQGFDNK